MVSPRVVQHNSPCVPNKTGHLVKSFKTNALVKSNNFEVFSRKLTDFKYEYYICIIEIFLCPQCMWFSVKNPPNQAGDTDSIPGSGRFPAEGNGNLLQYSYQIPWTEELGGL